MPLEHYTCAKCGERCVDVTPGADQIAVAEYEALHRKKFKRGQAAPICDDCYREFLEWFLERSPPGPANRHRLTRR